MKKFITIILIFVVNNTNAQLDSYVRFGEKARPAMDINYYGTKKISEKFSLNYFGLIEKTWGEALIGGSYSPNNNLSFTAMTGVEHGSSKPRLFLGVWTGKNNNSILAMYEKGAGKGNYWYRINAYHTFSKSFTAGITSWRFNGTGVNLRYTKKDVTIWSMPGYDLEYEVARLMVGVNIKM